jgi:hypothetical protein
VHVGNLAHITVVGHTGAGHTEERHPLVDGRSYTALKMGNVVVAGDVNLGLDGVTAEIRFDALDVNLASDSLKPDA